MNMPCLRLVPLLLFATFTGFHPAAAQVPGTLLHSLFDPANHAQAGAQEGFSVAVEGNLAVIGAPYDDQGGTNSGIVNLYDATTGVRLHSLTNPSPAPDDRFGWSVAISGTRVVVGAYLDDTGATNAGRVYVFDLAGAIPTAPVFTLNNPSPAVDDLFGWAVAISGTRVVVGAQSDDAGAEDAGSAYIYDLAGATPTVPVLLLTKPGAVPDDRFGVAVGISGTRVIVGAYRDDTGAMDAGSAYIYDVAGATPAVPVAMLPNPTPVLRDFFGITVAISGTRAVVGAYLDDAGAPSAGSAYVFELAGATPTVPAFTLTNPNRGALDFFGFSVAISGARVVVGAYRDDTGAANAGRAYVFDVTSATPTVPVATLKNPTPAAEDLFGWSVAISGTRVVAGAYQDDTGAMDAGSAYVFDLATATPAAPVATLNNFGRRPDHAFGISVSVSGTRVIAGAQLDDAGGTDAGAAYIYDLAGATPTVPVLTLTNPLPAAFAYFGSSVAISGQRAVVGAFGASAGDLFSGTAYVYDLGGVTPGVPLFPLNNPNPSLGGFFGRPVAIAGARVVVGAPFDSTTGANAGIAYVYDLAGATPSVPVLTLNNPNPATVDYFGIALAISGTRVVVGAYRDEPGAVDSGSAYIYELTSATPSVPLFTLLNPSPAAGDNFGNAVAIAGPRVVVGALLDDTGASDAGSVYVYDLAGATPTMPVTTLNNPSPAAGDHFGNAVAITGTRVMVGAQLDDTGAMNAGSAYIYDLAGATPTVPVAVLTNPSPGAEDSFGLAVAMDGATMVAGAPGDDSNATDRGAAYIFDLRPVLKIIPAAPGQATISWSPASLPGFVLQGANSLAPGSWNNAPSGALNPVTIPSTNAARFYRLAQP